MGLYPKHHLWGVDAIEQNEDFDIQISYTESIRIPTLLEKSLNKTIFKETPGVRIEFAALKASRNSDLIYSVCGPLTISKFVPNKIISWVFRPPANNLHTLCNPYHEKALSQQAGFFCLTPKAEEFYSQFSSAKFIPWCVDLELFDGRSVEQRFEKPFFLASGKTGRDYKTLIKASGLINAEIRIIGPKTQKPAFLPDNVDWVDTSSDPPDQAIDYPTLREWYSQSIGICIPLNGDADDTCGYTNMLEGMAMQKPILMTQSGSLHIDPETEGFGIRIKPRDAEDWAQAMNHLLHDREKALQMGNRGREIVERDFRIERFNKNVIEFIENILNEA